MAPFLGLTYELRKGMLKKGSSSSKVVKLTFIELLSIAAGLGVQITFWSQNPTKKLVVRNGSEFAKNLIFTIGMVECFCKIAVHSRIAI